MFDTLQDRLAATFKTLRGKGRLTEADVDAVMREIRIALLEADVALPVVREFIAAVKVRALGADVHAALNPAQQIIKIVDEELVVILGGETRRLRFAKSPPTVLMLAGLQGSGKTTLAGKIGRWLQEQGRSPLLVAADLQRPNAVNQLQVVGEQAAVDVYAPQAGNVAAADPTSQRGGERDHERWGDPVAVARDSINHARRTLHDVVVIDTAGRLGIDTELMQQAADIRDAVHPDETLFVIDAMIGQDAVTTAQAFLDGVDFDAVVLTKLDGDARGGAALSVAKVTGRPVMFASNGEKLTDFDLFHPDRMASRILGMGDMLTLIEQAEKTFDAEQTQAAAAKLQGKGTAFTLDDFLQQMQAVRKMGSLSKIFGMFPGMGELKDQIAGIDERDIDRLQAIIQSMTPAERSEPRIIGGSRRQRISRGSGTTVQQVNQLVDRFFEARTMMTQIAGGGVPGMPGMPGIPGGGKRAKARQPGGKGRSRRGSGNPAKRAQEAAQRQSGAGAPGTTGSPFGDPDGPGREPGKDFELPKHLRDQL